MERFKKLAVSAAITVMAFIVLAFLFQMLMVAAEAISDHFYQIIIGVGVVGIFCGVWELVYETLYN